MRKDIRIIKIILAKYEHCVTIESGFCEMINNV